MPRWSVIILALALILSLPQWLAGAASLPFQVRSVMTAVSAPADDAIPRDETAPRTLVAVTGQCDHAGFAPMSAAHAAGQCGMGASCAIGDGPAALRVDEPRFARLHIVHLVSDPASHFLTNGIDRPPRLSFA